MTTQSYPNIFPLPTLNNYAINVDMGVTRVQMERGNTKQRRRYTTMPQRFNATFILPFENLQKWQLWVNRYGYEYFSINLTSYITDGANGDRCNVHFARFIGDLAIRPLTRDVVEVTAILESPNSEQDVDSPIEFTDDWYIAKTPADASTPHWYIGGSPDAPSIDHYIAGSPNNPAAFV